MSHPLPRRVCAVLLASTLVASSCTSRTQNQNTRPTGLDFGQKVELYPSNDSVFYDPKIQNEFTADMEGKQHTVDDFTFTPEFAEKSHDLLNHGIDFTALNCRIEQRLQEQRQNSQDQSQEIEELRQQADQTKQKMDKISNDREFQQQAATLTQQLDKQGYNNTEVMGDFRNLNLQEFEDKADQVAQQKDPKWIPQPEKGKEEPKEPKLPSPDPGQEEQKPQPIVQEPLPACDKGDNSEILAVLAPAPAILGTSIGSGGDTPTERPPEKVPEPSSVAGVLLAGALFAWFKQTKKKQKQKQQQ